MTDGRALLEAHLNGEPLSEAQRDALSAWVCASPDNAKLAAELTHLSETIALNIKAQSFGSLMDSPETDLYHEAIDQDEPAQATDQAELPPIHIETNTLTKEKYVAALTYVLQHTFTPKRLITGGIAAALLLGAVLAIVFLGGSDPQDQIAETPAPLDPSTPPALIDEAPVDKPIVAKPVVARLTAEHQARWQHDPGRDTLEPGDVFYADQELTLLSGFAEITTAQNAVILLEAPCKIVFDQNDNLLHLSKGKLAAIVPEQATGFTVWTPTARLVDFGTQFGVEVKADGQTHTAVFTGEVELSELSTSPQQPARNIRLTAGWASQVSAQGELQREPKAIAAHDLSRYALSIQAVAEPGYAYRRAVLASEPLMYWGFDERQARTANLAGQDAFAGRALGQTDDADGLFGGALKLTGQAQSAGAFASEMPLTVSHSNRFTLEAWIWINEPHHGRLMSFANPVSEQFPRPRHHSLVEFIAGPNLSNSLKPHDSSIRFMHLNTTSEDTPADKTINGTNIFAKSDQMIGQWVHLVSVKDGQQAHLYLNGELVSTGKGTPSATTNDLQLNLVVGATPSLLVADLAASSPEYRVFNGLIDEVAVYPSALSLDTIQTHYRLGRPDGDESLSP